MPQPAAPTPCTRTTHAVFTTAIDPAPAYLDDLPALHAMPLVQHAQQHRQQLRVLQVGPHDVAAGGHDEAQRLDGHHAAAAVGDILRRLAVGGWGVEVCHRGHRCTSLRGQCLVATYR